MSSANVESTLEPFLPKSNRNSQVHVTFVRSSPASNEPSSLVSINDRTPSSLLALKHRRLVQAADRKKRLITRIITIVGLLIILLCAMIVTLTLKMAPKIDELVRTKTGSHQFIQLMSRTSTTTTSTNNTTTMLLT